MIKQPIVQKIRAVSPVWIVPIVALMIAVWLAVQARLEKGSEIKITFANASDVIAGQTLIKLKDVEVGVVKKVVLSEDLKSVTLSAEIDRSVSRHLSSNTRFWVVTPRISAAGVSNLGTLISGVYIVMDPGEKGDYATRFVGLDHPPTFESDEPGTQFVLRAEELGSLDIGSPIYYRQIRVGEVTGYRLSDSQENVEINFFVHAPHDKLILTGSRFWNVSGFGLSINADGMKAKMASLASLINGGVAFDNAASFENATRAEAGHQFYLHPDRDSVLEGQFNIAYYYRLKFSGSVRGLTVGAPVEFRGIKVGEVVNVELASAGNDANSLHVYIAMEPQRFDPSTAPSRDEVDGRVEQMVAQGLRAQMKTASLITGSRYIDLVFVDNTDTGEFVRAEKYSEIPTVADDLDQVGKQLGDVLERVSAIPFEQIGRDLAASMVHLNRLLAALDRENTPQNLNRALVSANTALVEIAQTMKTLEQAAAPDSALNYELSGTLKSVGDAARSLQLLLDELNRHPNALISGAKKDE